jgi:hypothetical protein
MRELNAKRSPELFNPCVDLCGLYGVGMDRRRFRIWAQPVPSAYDPLGGLLDPDNHF